jgi:hypothetical protein
VTSSPVSTDCARTAAASDRTYSGGFR